jgi:hypothetical protein
MLGAAQRWRVIEGTLGSGCSGQVTEVEFVPSGKRYARKVALLISPADVAVATTSPFLGCSVPKELLVLSSLPYDPAFVQCCGFEIIHSRDGRCLDEKELHIYMEVAKGGSMKSLAKAYSSYSVSAPPFVPSEAVALVDAMYLLYLNRVVHRDIKPENILFMSSTRPHIESLVSKTTPTVPVPRMTLADFGEGKANVTLTCSIGIGNMYYRAPERDSSSVFHNAATGYGVEGEVYSLGVLLCIRNIRDDPRQHTTDRMLVNEPVVVTEQGDDADLIRRCVENDPRLRLPMMDVYHHQWFRAVREEEYLRHAKAVFSVAQSLEPFSKAALLCYAVHVAEGGFCKGRRQVVAGTRDLVEQCVVECRRIGAVIRKAAAGPCFVAKAQPLLLKTAIGIIMEAKQVAATNHALRRTLKLRALELLEVLLVDPDTAEALRRSTLELKKSVLAAMWEMGEHIRIRNVRTGGFIAIRDKELICGPEAAAAVFTTVPPPEPGGIAFMAACGGHIAARADFSASLSSSASSPAVAEIGFLILPEQFSRYDVQRVLLRSSRLLSFLEAYDVNDGSVVLEQRCCCGSGDPWELVGAGALVPSVSVVLSTV